MRVTIKALFLASLLASTQSAFSDTLSGIYELALQNDAQLKAAEAQYRAELETEELAFSQLLPQIGATGEYSDTDGSGSSVFLPAGGDDDVETTREGYAISLDQKLFDMNSWFSFKSGKQVSEKAKAQFAADQQDLIVRVAEAYFNVLTAKDSLAASRSEEKATKRQLEQTQQRFDVGLIAITDVHEARAAYDLTVVNRLNDEGLLGVTLEALTVITGQIHNNLWLLNEEFPISNPDPLSRDEWVAFAMKNNYALKASGYSAESALLQAKAAKANHYPTLSGSISYSDFSEDGTQFGRDVDTQNEQAVIGLRLTVPIYTGGGTSAARRQAFEQYNASRELQTGTMRNTIQATRSLHLAVMTDVARVGARRQSITSSQSAVDATQAGYEVGTRNVVDVLQAQRVLFASLKDYANSRYNYVINMFKLKRQAGTLSPEDIYKLNEWLINPPSKTTTINPQY